MRSSSTAALAIVAIISLQLQLQLNNYHKITLCVRLDAQEGQRPSIKLIRANVGGHCPKQALGHCRNWELADILSKHWDYSSVWPVLQPLLHWQGDTARLIEDESPKEEGTP